MYIQDGPTDYAFWKQKLVASGYTLTESTPTPDGGTIYFNGNGLRNGEIAATAAAASVIATK